MAAIEQQKTSFAIPKLAQDLIAGTIGGWAQVVVGHPFDTLKVRMQTQPSPPIYKNALDCFNQLVKSDGPKGVYRGVASPLAELLKVKLQTQDPKGVIGANGKLEVPYKGVVDCGIRTVRAHGLQGIYRGLGITLLRDFPSYGLYFVTYEGLKRTFQAMKKNPEEQLNTFDLLMAGGLAGFCAWIPAYPQDVLKSRLQNDPRIKSSLAALRTLLREGGARTLLTGIGPTMARAFPANAATFFAFEMAMETMNKL
ncbi:mitochondrial carrier domain-containing protein [Absidia repens]|uniref:Mitochondrial carrier domain-containing protein n=1 Tax=Absidia repens TaxID=90262 RepID=A0A1X2J2U9_9FUNG|nr:mitochondrial carrier domain-containing protein [Absidia repens]